MQALPNQISFFEKLVQAMRVLSIFKKLIFYGQVLSFFKRSAFVKMIESDSTFDLHYFTVLLVSKKSHFLFSYIEKHKQTLSSYSNNPEIVHTIVEKRMVKFIRSTLNCFVKFV